MTEIKHTGYMVSPLDLSERQLLIYRALYTRADFNTMLVDMTIDQVISQIKIIDLSSDIVYREIKKLQRFGYIELVKKASKGNAPIYKIINYSELMCKPNQNQMQTKSKPKHSNFNGLNNDSANQIKTKSKPNPSTIKEKEKENNIYSRVITRLNESTNSNYRHTTKKTRSLIDARLKEKFTEDDFYKVIDVKVNEWINNPDMRNYLRPETLFGNKFEGYLNQHKHETELQEVKPEAQEFKFIDFKIGE